MPLVKLLILITCHVPTGAAHTSGFHPKRLHTMIMHSPLQQMNHTILFHSSSPLPTPVRRDGFKNSLCFHPGFSEHLRELLCRRQRPTLDHGPDYSNQTGVKPILLAPPVSERLGPQPALSLLVPRGRHDPPKPQLPLSSHWSTWDRCHSHTKINLLHMSSDSWVCNYVPAKMESCQGSGPKWCKGLG